MGKEDVNILLVEDNKINQQICVTLLNRRKWNVCVVENGQEALNLLDSNTFDLILMDIVMPKMDGLTTTTIIRKKEKEQGIYTPIIAITGSVSEEIKKQCFESGMDAFIPKPIKFEDFYITIEQFLIK